MSQSLTGKVAIVTGGSRGIGAGIVKELAKRGASVAFTYLSSAKAQLLLNELHSSGIRAIAIQADCADAAASAKKIVGQVVASFGQIDIIVNNAGNGEDHSLSDVTEEQFNRIFHINLLFPLLLVQESVPYLQQKARIVNVGSITGRIARPAAYPSAILYAASKAGLDSVTKSLAFTLGLRGNMPGRKFEATVNTINPGPVATDMWEQTPGREEYEENLYPRTAAGDRVASVQDIAPIVAFLCEEQSRWVTGNVTCANGGLLMI
ncbi:hypothetical protein ASPVEDRAFT_33653 [Aspergillus versicolor CBS 583.65]|uniref:Uncharacterized protein n=1 Tax=Aspergillus versicolor CBS 583.65 TaxID=1036611 RepID=A0A1L9Q0Z8_ASPVE|nr:uncharacterized protein ASPVEDRAFT_33653 [Aspergillus versicolor CBS 583.65]OJJ07430.1 hypothetical protein ASPVEDRAFT_33653 [Aspergillus versicolor CBS 583.65]